MRRHYPAVILAPAAILLCGLGILGWRLLSQERMLAVQRQRADLESAALSIQRALESLISSGRAVALEWDSTRLLDAQGAPLLWWPGASGGGEARADLFAAAEEAEFHRSDLAAAIELYRGFTNSPDHSIRAGALVREARSLRKAGRQREAMAVYAALAQLGDARVNGSPAEWISLREQEDRAALDSQLAAGRFRVDKATFEFFAQGSSIRDDQRRWAEAADRMLSEARNRGWGSMQFGSPPQPLVGMWSNNRGVLIEPPAWPVNTAWTIEDERGRVLLGRLPPASKVTASRTLSVVGGAWAIRTASTNPKREEALTESKVKIWGAALFVLLLGGMSAAILAARAVRMAFTVAQQQTDFVAAVSHEFRSPLTAISHLTESLNAGVVESSRQAQYYAALAKETGRLRRLVEGLLEFARIESGGYALHRERIPTGAFAESVAEEFRSQAAGRSVEFTCAKADSVISADRVLLGRALWNLLDNAVKYTPADSPVRVAVSSSGAFGEISVADSGPGIPKEEQKAIFRKFVRGSGASAANVKGTGLGLAIAAAAARAHGGHISLESGPAGSVFTLFIPEVDG